jgi:hypothetical protein
MNSCGFFYFATKTLRHKGFFECVGMNLFADDKPDVSRPRAYSRWQLIKTVLVTSCLCGNKKAPCFHEALNKR